MIIRNSAVRRGILCGGRRGEEGRGRTVVQCMIDGLPWAHLLRVGAPIRVYSYTSIVISALDVVLPIGSGPAAAVVPVHVPSSGSQKLWPIQLLGA